MNRYLKIIGAILAFVLLIGGSMAAYNKLSKEYKKGDNLQVEETAVPTKEPQSTTDDTTDDTQDAAQDTKEERTKAIDFTVQDLDGEQVSLLSKVGKPLVLNFWASWCGPCKSEMPDFQTVFEEMGEDVEFVMVNLTDNSRETVDSAKKFIDKEGFTFPVYFDTEQSAAYAYYVTSIPTTFFIDKDGYIVTYAQGALDEETLRRGIGMITN